MPFRKSSSASSSSSRRGSRRRLEKVSQEELDDLAHLPEGFKNIQAKRTRKIVNYGVDIEEDDVIEGSRQDSEYLPTDSEDSDTEVTRRPLSTPAHRPNASVVPCVLEHMNRTEAGDASPETPPDGGREEQDSTQTEEPVVAENEQAPDEVPTENPSLPEVPKEEDKPANLLVQGTDNTISKSELESLLVIPQAPKLIIVPANRQPHFPSKTLRKNLEQWTTDDVEVWLTMIVTDQMALDVLRSRKMTNEDIVTMATNVGWLRTELRLSDSVAFRLRDEAAMLLNHYSIADHYKKINKITEIREKMGI